MQYFVTLSKVRAQGSCVWHLWSKTDTGFVESYFTGFASDYDECKRRATRCYLTNVSCIGKPEDLNFIDEGERDVLFPDEVVRRYDELQFNLKQAKERLNHPIGDDEDADVYMGAVDAAYEALYKFELEHPLLISQLSPYLGRGNFCTPG